MSSAQELARIIQSGLTHGFTKIREEAIAKLRSRNEVLA
jgi:predicted small metal-binding protein